MFPPHADPAGDCLLRSLLEAEPWRSECDWPEGFAGGIAHRLDVHTSGAILVADSPEELVALRELFRSGHLIKTYRLLANRDVSWDENRCDRAIAHDKRRRQRMIVQRGLNTPHRGRWHRAETVFQRLEGRLFEAVMTTGVMHQIRAHAAFLGIPLVGDPIYGGGSERTGQRLHHVGMRGPRGIATDSVRLPEWARTAAD